MSNVNIRKSVLQSIIRKSLKESGAKHNDVSRRISVGPESSTLPDMLPLSPSDRMSTQLEIERPPVEDPEYAPIGTKELGYALQALSEMIDPDDVEQVYSDFKRMIEKLNSDEDELNSDEDNLKTETMRRRSAIIRALLGEQTKGKDPMAGFYNPEDDADEDLADRPGEEPVKSMSSLRSKDLAQYETAMKNFDLNRSNVDKLLNAVYVYKLGKNDLETFIDILSTMEDPDEGIKDEVQKALESYGPGRLSTFVQSFNTMNTMSWKRASEKKKTLDKKAGPSDPGMWRVAAKEMGYAAESGLRQSFIRDVNAVRALPTWVSSKSDREFIETSIKEAFQAGLKSEVNRRELVEILDEDALDELIKEIGGEDASEDAMESSKIYRNFRGIITYEALSEIANMKFKAKSGKGFSREIGKPFMREFGDENMGPSSNEEFQLSKMAKEKIYLHLIVDILDAAEKNDYINHLSAAIIMAAEDADLAEYGTYLKPGFSTLKSLSPGKKTPDQVVGDFIKGSEGSDEFMSRVKSASQAARKMRK